MTGLAIFLWQAVGVTGRRQWGLMSATDEAALVERLDQRGLTLEHHRRLPDWIRALLKSPAQRLRGHEVSDFLHQLATLVSAGVPMVQGLRLVASDADARRLGPVIDWLANEVQSGTPLSSALAMQPRVFNERIHALVRAGEQSSSLDTLLTQIADYEARAQQIRRQIRAVLRYPLIVISVALLVSVAMILFVVPRFAAMFTGLDAELPALTQSVMALSTWLRAQGWMVVLITASLSLLVVPLMARRPTLRAGRDWLLLRLPVIGPMVAGAASAQFSRTLAIMTAAGLPMTEALPTIARTMNNIPYYQAVMQINERLHEGQSLEQAIAASQRLSGRIQQMIAVGEEAGRVDAMLRHIADIEDAQVNRAVESLSKAMEPLLMVMLGLIIGALVLAMYLPIFQMGAAV